MTAGSDGRVWYVSYGSNLFGARLRCYLEGGRPPGGARATPGARDPSPPAADRRVELDRALWFGGPSLTWRGAPAYLDREAPGTTIGRAWLLTTEQFADVVAQESGLAPGTVPTDATLLRGGVVADEASYGRIEPLAPLDGVPAATCTYVVRPPARAPDEDYLDMLRAGLRELGLADAEVAAYLRQQPQLRWPQP